MSVLSTGFCSAGIYNESKSILRKNKLDSDAFSLFYLESRAPEWVVTSREEAPNPTSLCHCCFTNVEGLDRI